MTTECGEFHRISSECTMPPASISREEKPVNEVLTSQNGKIFATKDEKIPQKI